MISSLLILVRIIEVTSIFQPDKSHHFFLAEKNVHPEKLIESHHTNMYLSTFDPLYGIVT